MRHAREKNARLNAISGLLDIGSSKIACAIVRYDREAGEEGLAHAHVVGFGQTRSRGVKFGAVVDLSEAEDSVRKAVGEAERQAGVTLDSVIVSVSCGRLTSQNFTAHAPVSERDIGAGDIARVIEAARAYCERDGRALVHLNKIGFAIDGAPVGANPLGMAAEKLSANLHAVTIDEAAWRNVTALIERCHLDVACMITTPFASAMAVTTREERELGVTCIDFGGGTATVATFADGHLIYADALTGGGGNITRDIAVGLQTSVAEAQRIKALYGTMIIAQSDAHDVFAYPSSEGEGDQGQATRAQLTQIIGRRVEAMLSLVAERLQRSGVRQVAGNAVVLTGGLSELPGIAEYAANCLSCPVRVGRPRCLRPIIEGGAGGSLSALMGLLPARLSTQVEVCALADERPVSGGYLRRVGQWLREGF